MERESQGKSVKLPEHEFLMGEGDDKVSTYTRSFIKRFQLADARDKDCRKVLGLFTGYLYTMAGMNLEPQDRSGRVDHERLIEVSGRVEFTSRICVIVGKDEMVYRFPKLRKTFAASCATFNMEQKLHEAAVTKMLSIVQMCVQCPLLSSFYMMIYRYHRRRCKTVT